MRNAARAMRPAYTATVFYGVAVAICAPAVLVVLLAFVRRVDEIPEWSPVPGWLVVAVFAGTMVVRFHRATERFAGMFPRRGRPELVSRCAALGVAAAVVLPFTGGVRPSAEGAAVLAPAALVTYAVAVVVGLRIHARRVADPLVWAGGARGPAARASGWRPAAQCVDLVAGGAVAALVPAGLGVFGATVAFAASTIVTLAGVGWLATLRAAPPAMPPPEAWPEPVRQCFRAVVAALAVVPALPEVVTLLGVSGERGLGGALASAILPVWFAGGLAALVALAGLAGLVLRATGPRPSRADLVVRAAGCLVTLAFLYVVPGSGVLGGAALLVSHLGVTALGLGPASRRRGAQTADLGDSGDGRVPKGVYLLAGDLVLLGVVQGLAWLRRPLMPSGEAGPLVMLPSAVFVAIGLIGAAALVRVLGIVVRPIAVRHGDTGLYVQSQSHGWRRTLEYAGAVVVALGGTAVLYAAAVEDGDILEVPAFLMVAAVLFQCLLAWVAGPVRDNRLAGVVGRAAAGVFALAVALPLAWPRGDWIPDNDPTVTDAFISPSVNVAQVWVHFIPGYALAVLVLLIALRVRHRRTSSSPPASPHEMATPATRGGPGAAYGPFTPGARRRVPVGEAADLLVIGLPMAAILLLDGLLPMPGDDIADATVVLFAGAWCAAWTVAGALWLTLRAGRCTDHAG